MKVVGSGYKIDLHIHSECSRYKDGNKVAYNTLDHMDTLVKRLTDNGVQICAITDHDVFGYDMYRKLKEYEGNSSVSVVRNCVKIT